MTTFRVLLAGKPVEAVHADEASALVSQRTILLGAMESIETASKQRGDMATARVAREALNTVYGSIR